MASACVLSHRTSPPAPACTVTDLRRADLRRPEPVAGVRLVDMDLSSRSQVTLPCQSAPLRAGVRVEWSRQEIITVGDLVFNG